MLTLPLWVLSSSYIHRPFLPSPQHPVSASPTSVIATFKAAVESVTVYDEIFRKTNEIQQSSHFVPQVSTLVIEQVCKVQNRAS